MAQNTPYPERMLRCRQCGCVQPASGDTCKNCGEDLALFGEVIKASEAALFQPPSEEVLSDPPRRKEEDRPAPKKSLWKAVLPALIVVGLVGGGLWLHSRQKPSPTAHDTPTQPPTVQTDGPAETAAPAVEGAPVAEKADLDAFARVPENAVPDLYYFSDGRATYQKEPTVKDRSYYSYETDPETVERYVEMLQKNGFTLADTYSFSYKNQSFCSWGFRSNAMPNAGTIPLQYKDESPCHISLYFSEKPGKYFMEVAPDFEVRDTGARYDGSTADLRPSGPSVAAGVVRLSDGSYQTTDGRLTAAVGTAMVLRDGVSCVQDAAYTLENGGQVIRIKNVYRDEGIYFHVSEGALLAGDILTQRELRRWNWHSTASMNDMGNFLWPGAPVLAMPAGGAWRGATFNEDVYRAQTLRVMAYDPGGVGVFYFYSSFRRGEPSEVEALCVVDMTAKSSPVLGENEIPVGGTKTLEFTHTEFMPEWSLYDWTILEGDDKISIEPNRKTCTVTGLAPGEATIQVEYNYGKKIPDVLTGNPTTVSRTKKETYHVVVK